MTEARAQLPGLVERGLIDVAPTALGSAPPAPLPPGFELARLDGLLLGLAIGDALGNTSEGMPPARRRAQYGEIRDYLPNRYADDRPAGLPSDDTQLAFWTLEHLLEDGALDPERLADRFAAERIFGIGGTVREFLRRWKAGHPWYGSGPASAGNGALMRIAPVAVPYVREPSADLWADTVLAAALTHNDRASTASCLAFVHLLWEALRAERPPDPAWWLREFVRVAQGAEGDASRYTTRGGAYAGYEGPLWRFVELAVGEALQAGLTTLESAERTYSGAYVLETAACAIHILACHAGDPEEALVRAVNDTRDNDTVGAVVGAAVGALHGAGALPERWREELLGRTRDDDDGHVFRLVAAARARFGPSVP